VRAFLAVIASALVLAGCVSKEELQARHDAAMAQNAAADDQKCQSFGAVPGSESYIQCRTSLAAARAQAAALAQPPISSPQMFPAATCRPIGAGAVSCQ
jgi:PBP1b-binding outer membrane lipoprotein LpoB